MGFFDPFGGAADIGELKSDLSSLKSDVKTHTNDNDIHVTASDKSNWNSKLDKNQGSENSGKVLGTNANGEVIPLNGYGFEYDEETKMLKYGTDPTSNLNQGIGLDDTLSKRGYAADAGAVGELKEDLTQLNNAVINGENIDIDVNWESGSYVCKTGEMPTKTNSMTTRQRSGFTLKEDTNISVTDGYRLFVCLLNSDGTCVNTGAFITTSRDCVKGNYVCIFSKTDDTDISELNPMDYISGIQTVEKTQICKNKEDIADIKEDIADIKVFVNAKHEITVGSDKDFTSFFEAINSITDSSETNRYTVYVHEGIYETVFAENIVSGYKGLIIPDYVDIIGIGDRENIIINGILPDGDYSSYANTISTINLTGNNIVENVTIKAKNIRYCNHDDGSEFGMFRSEHIFRRVKFIYEAPTSGISVAGCACGIGSQFDKRVIFEDCYIINRKTNGYGIFYHDNGNPTQQNSGRLEVKNCIFETGSTGADITLSNSNGNLPCYATITGNLLSRGICFMTASDSITKNVWYAFICGNKNYSLQKKIGMVDVDLSPYITDFNNN